MGAFLKSNLLNRIARLFQTTVCSSYKLAVRSAITATAGRLVSAAKDARHVAFVFYCNRNAPNYFLDMKQNQLKYGFEWVHPNATISVDLDLQNPDTAMFLELLYYRSVYYVYFGRFYLSTPT